MVVEYEVPDRAGDGKDELIALVTTITDFREAPAAVLAAASTPSPRPRPTSPAART
jgi:hypothetical protein